jgi:hypothetical protein
MKRLEDPRPYFSLEGLETLQYNRSGDRRYIIIEEFSYEIEE